MMYSKLTIFFLLLGILLVSSVQFSSAEHPIGTGLFHESITETIQSIADTDGSDANNISSHLDYPVNAFTKAIDGNVYAFIAAEGSDLLIISDVTNPAFLKLVSVTKYDYEEPEPTEIENGGCPDCVSPVSLFIGLPSIIEYVEINNIPYIIVGSFRTLSLQIFDIRDLEAPVLVSNGFSITDNLIFPEITSLHSVKYGLDTYLLIFGYETDSTGFLIYNINDPSDPKLVSAVPLMAKFIEDADIIEINGKRILTLLGYTTSGDPTIQIFDITSIHDVILLDTYYASGGGYDEGTVAGTVAGTFAATVALDTDTASRNTAIEYAGFAAGYYVGYNNGFNSHPFDGGFSFAYDASFFNVLHIEPLGQDRDIYDTGFHNGVALAESGGFFLNSDLDALGDNTALLIHQSGSEHFIFTTDFETQKLQIINISDINNPVSYDVDIPHLDRFLGGAMDILTIDTLTYLLIPAAEEVHVFDISIPFQTNYVERLSTDDMDNIFVTHYQVDGNYYMLTLASNDNALGIFSIGRSSTSNESDTGETSNESDTGETSNESDTGETSGEPDNSKKKKGGGSDSRWKTKPTFGLSHQTYKQLVDDGFSFNNNTFTITDNWHTPFDVQNVTLGEANSFSAKTYAQNKLMVQEFLFGIPEVGESQKAELGIEVWYDINGIIEKIIPVQKTNIVDPLSINATHFKVKCQPTDSVKRCDNTEISMVFLEPLKDDIMAIKAIDFEKRTHITFLNDGFDISGISLNPMLVQTTPGPEKYEGLILLTQTAKYSDIWVAEDGREFEINDYGTVKQINRSFERNTDTGIPRDRLHSEYYRVIQYEKNRAITIYDELCPQCSDVPFNELDTMFGHDTSNTFNDNLQERVDYEAMLAEQRLNEMYKLVYSNSPYYKDMIE